MGVSNRGIDGGEKLEKKIGKLFFKRKIEKLREWKRRN